MTRAITMALALALCSGWAIAEPPAVSTPPVQKKAAKAAMSKYMGTVETVDSAMGKLSVKSKKEGIKEFTIGADIKITQGGKTIPLSGISSGDTATVSYSGTAAAPEVKSVRVAKAKKK